MRFFLGEYKLKINKWCPHPGFSYDMYFLLNMDVFIKLHVFSINYMDTQEKGIDHACLYWKHQEAPLDFDLIFIYRKLILFLVLQCEVRNKKKVKFSHLILFGVQWSNEIFLGDYKLKINK